MKKNTRSYSMYFAFMSIIIILFGTGHMGTAQAQSPWTSKTDMPTGRYALSSGVVNEKIYIIGGVPTGNGCYDPASPKVEEYKPFTDTWDTTKTDIPTARNSFSISVVNDTIYAIGGQSVACDLNLSSVDVYDPITDTWDTTKTAMPAPRVGLSTSVVNDKIYVIGGWNGSPAIYSADVWEYNPQTDTWETKEPMPTARAYLSTCVIDEKIYAFGGRNENTAFKTVEAYDPVTNSWTSMADMPDGRIYLSASSVNGLVYIFGGSTHPTNSPMSNVWEYNPALDSFKIVSPMPTGLVHGSSTEVNGKIYVIGGSATAWPFQPGYTVNEYNPHNDLLRLVDFVNVDKGYAIPGADNVLITTKINNLAGITLFAEIEAPDQTPVDSLELFDDGNHNDGDAGDSIFANSWLVSPVEESNYYIDLQVTRVDTDTVINHLNNMALFTTIGPIKFDNYEIPQQIANLFSLKYSLRNDGSTNTATTVSAVVLTTDTNVTNILGTLNFGNIEPGQVKNTSSSFPHYIYTQNNPSSIDFIVHIFSNGHFFWSDSFTVDVPVGIAENETNLPIEYALKQNYPNPFNPTTTIKYQIPELSFVTLKVYDVLGSEIATLINEEKPVGSYEVKLDGIGLSSGIYFYRLQAGSYIETKKMVLLK